MPFANLTAAAKEDFIVSLAILALHDGGAAVSGGVGDAVLCVVGGRYGCGGCECARTVSATRATSETSATRRSLAPRDRVVAARFLTAAAASPAPPARFRLIPSNLR